MAITLSLRGTASTALHIGAAGLSAGVLSLVGYPCEVQDRVLEIPGVTGTLELHGFGADVVAVYQGIPFVTGSCSFTGYPAAVAQEWLGLSPCGVLMMAATGSDALAVTQHQYIETVSGELAFGADAADTGAVRSYIPPTMFSGYSCDGTTLHIPLASLSGLTAEEADASNGDWREIFQAAVLALDQWFEKTPLMSRPATVSRFLIDDWNARHPTLGRVMRRNASLRFHIKYATSKLVEED